jgi:outer membrane protein insertion porin family
MAVSALAQQVVVTEIDIRGNDRITDDAILLQMQTEVGEPFSEDVLTQDESTLLDLGFFQDVQTSFVEDTEGIVVIVDVEENPVIKEVAIDGNTVIDTETLTEAITDIQPLDRVLNARNLNPIAEAVTELYTEEGFFALVVDLAPLSDSPNTLYLRISEFTVGTIEFTGLSRTRPSLVKQIMETEPGEAYSVQRLRDDVAELGSTSWFSDIEVNEDLTEAEGRVDLVIDFAEARTAQIAAGVALDPQSRLVGTASYSDSNFLGQGKNVNLSLSQATVGGGISAEIGYVDRYFDESDTRLSVRLFSKVVYNFTGSGLGPFESPGDEDRFDERRTGGQVTLSRPIGEDFRAMTGLRAERIETINLRADSDASFIQQDGDLLVLQAGVDYDTRRPSLEPTRGNYASLMIEPGFSDISDVGGSVAENRDILGSNTFLRTTLEYRQYWSRPVPADTPVDEIPPRPVVALRAKYGIISGTTPFFEQLFVGGSGSLRGYPNQRFWGDQSFLASAEYRYPIQEAFNAIAFVDYGGAWGGYGEFEDFTQSDSLSLKLGYGVGVGFRTPIGPIRIDFAFNEDGGSRTHFSFGTSF